MSAVDSFTYFLDTDLPAVLSEHLTQALDSLSNTLAIFQQVSKVDDLFLSLVEHETTSKATQSIIFCWNYQYKSYAKFLYRDSPPCILSPLWALSSAIRACLQPTEYYLSSQKKVLSGLVIDLTCMAHRSQQRAYASYIHHMGGQVIFSQPGSSALCLCLCLRTHVVEGSAVSATSTTTAITPCACASASATATASTVPGAAQWLQLYHFLIATHTHTALVSSISSDCCWPPRPARDCDTTFLRPQHVNPAWVRACLQRCERVSELSYLVPSAQPSACTPLLHSRHDMVSQAGVDCGGAWSVSDARSADAYEHQVVQAKARFEQQPDLSVFSRSDVFRVSSQYQGAVRACVLAAIQHLGGSVAEHVDMLGEEGFTRSGDRERERDNVFIVCRDRSCVLYTHLTAAQLSAAAVTHLYLFACCDFSRRLPLPAHAPWSPASPFPRPAAQHWAALFSPRKSVTHGSSAGCSTTSEDEGGEKADVGDQVNTTSTLVPTHPSCRCGEARQGCVCLCQQIAVAHCFAPLYRPLPAFAHVQGGVPGMSAMVICTTGFSDLQRACDRWAKKLRPYATTVFPEERYSHTHPRKRKHKEEEEEEEASPTEHSLAERSTSPEAEDERASSVCGFQLHGKSGCLELQHAIRLCGACFVGDFIPSLTTHLVCAAPSGNKYGAAVAYNASVPAAATGKLMSSSVASAGTPPHKVHLVTEEWLWQSMRAWHAQEEALYAIRGGETVYQTEDMIAMEEEGGQEGKEQGATTLSQCVPTLGADSPPPSPSRAAVVSSEPSGALAPLIGSSTCLGSSSDQLWGGHGHGHGHVAVDSFEVRSLEESGLPQVSPASHIPSFLSPALSTQTQLQIQLQTQTQAQVSQSQTQTQTQALNESPLKQQDTKPKAPHQDMKYFMLGTASAEKSSKARAVLERLGAVVLTSEGGAYDTLCTHMLLWRFERTEKCMCACAAGKWILYPDEYLAECERVGNLVDEAAYEWFDPSDTIKKHYHYNDQKAPWLGACRRGRERLESHCLPFGDLLPVAFIVSEDLKPPQPTLCTLVLAGGGVVDAVYTVPQYQQYCQNRKQQQHEVGGSSSNRRRRRIGRGRHVVCSAATQSELEEQLGLSFSVTLPAEDEAHEQKDHEQSAVPGDYFVQPKFLTDRITTQFTRL